MAETKKPALSPEAKAKQAKALAALKAGRAKITQITAAVTALDKNVDDLDKVGS